MFTYQCHVLTLCFSYTLDYCRGSGGDHFLPYLILAPQNTARNSPKLPCKNLQPPRTTIPPPPADMKLCSY